MTDLDLGYGLKLRADTRSVWLVLPDAEMGLHFKAQQSPVFRAALLGFLKEHMPEGSAEVRGYLERIAATQARLTAPDSGAPKAESGGQGR